MSKGKWNIFTVSEYEKKVIRIYRKARQIRKIKRSELFGDEVKDALCDIISEANSILAHIRHSKNKHDISIESESENI